MVDDAPLPCDVSTALINPWKLEFKLLIASVALIELLDDILELLLDVLWLLEESCCNRLWIFAVKLDPP